MVSTFLVAIARNYWLLFTARILQGCSSAIVWTVGMAVLADTMPTEQLGVAMGTIGSVVSLAMLSSPVIGGTIYHTFGYVAVFWFLGALLLVDLILRLLMIEQLDAKEWTMVAASQDPGPDETQPLLNGSTQSGSSPATKSWSLLVTLFSVRAFEVIKLSIVPTLSHSVMDGIHFLNNHFWPIRCRSPAPSQGNI
jgi:MFS family permease